MISHQVTRGEHLNSKFELEDFLAACEQIQPGFAQLHFPGVEVDTTLFGPARIVTRVDVGSAYTLSKCRARFPTAWAAAPPAARAMFYLGFLNAGGTYLEEILDALADSGIDTDAAQDALATSLASARQALQPAIQATATATVSGDTQT